MTQTLSIPQRGAILLVLGTFFSLVLNLLQLEHHITLFPSHAAFPPWSAWWIPPSVAVGSLIIGFTFPWADRKYGGAVERVGDWSATVRSVGMFIGINYASAKLPFSSKTQLSSMLGLMSIGMWWLFDRTRRGFLMGLIAMSFGTLCIQLIVFLDFYSYTEPDFFLIRSWIPCVLFSGTMCFGNIGRQLALATSSDGTGGASDGASHRKAGHLKRE